VLWSGEKGMADNKSGWIDEIIRRVGKAASIFTAFLFFVFTAGMLFALVVVPMEPLLLFIPPLLGFAAYLNPRIAGLLLIGLFVLLFL
jgi:hypothetical protein